MDISPTRIPAFAAEAKPFVIVNPDNNLAWFALDRAFHSCLSGQYTGYQSRALAERVIRRVPKLRGRGMVVMSEIDYLNKHMPNLMHFSKDAQP
jgi:hypothetical protein